MSRREPIDKGVSIFRPANSKIWHLQVNLPGRRRSRTSLNTRDLETARALARQRSDEIHTRASGVVIPRDVPYD